MNKLKATALAGCAVFGAAAGWAAMRLMLAGGKAIPVLDYTSLYSLAAVCAVVLYLGIRVKRSTLGKSHFEPVAAARTLVLAQAAAYAGAVITGWHVPPAASLLLDSAGSPTFVRALVLAGAGVAMVVVGYIVQHLCKLPPEEPDDSAEPMAAD